MKDKSSKCIEINILHDWGIKIEHLGASKGDFGAIFPNTWKDGRGAAHTPYPLKKRCHDV